MEEKIRQIMADVFLLDINEIDDQSSPENLGQWDSLANLNLVVALEEEFEIELNTDQIIEMLNFKLVLIIIEEAIKNKNI